MIFEGFQLSRS